jgi:hypothetical protein
MGSLMAGWSSHVLQDDNKGTPDSKVHRSMVHINIHLDFYDRYAVGFMRNRSLTKEEVKAFWRQHKKPEVDNDGKTVEVTPPPLTSSPHVRCRFCKIACIGFGLVN